MVSVGDGIARVYGSNKVQAGEMVEFASGFLSFLSEFFCSRMGGKAGSIRESALEALCSTWPLGCGARDDPTKRKVTDQSKLAAPVVPCT